MDWTSGAVLSAIVALVVAGANAVIQVKLKFASSKEEALGELKSLALWVLNVGSTLVSVGLLVSQYFSPAPVSRAFVVTVALVTLMLSIQAAGFLTLTVLKLIDRVIEVQGGLVGLQEKQAGLLGGLTANIGKTVDVLERHQGEVERD